MPISPVFFYNFELGDIHPLGKLFDSQANIAAWLVFLSGSLLEGDMDRTRILIVDDHEIFRKGLRSVIESRPELEICGEATNGVEAVEKAKQIQPDVILMDISMPYLDGLQATRQIRSEVPTSQIQLLSQHDSPHMLAAALETGASAYVTKSQVSLCLLETLGALIRHEPFSWNSDGHVPNAQSGSVEGGSKIK